MNHIQPQLFASSESQLSQPLTQFDVWAAAGKDLSKQHGNLQWKIGDWLALGHRAYGDSVYETAERITGKKRQTLYQFASVAKRVADCMRHTNLSWEHHQIVAPLEPSQQKRWLDVAEKKSLTAKQLRSAVSGKVAPPEDGLKSQVPHDWTFRTLPLHDEDIRNLEALAFSREIQPGSLGTKQIPAPIRLAHQIIREYMGAHAKEVEDARTDLAYKRLGMKKG
jgi:hypothetical protein